MFVNKAWPYGEPEPDHEFLALNYRITELQGAVADAQLDKLDGRGRAPRIANGGAAHRRELAGVAGRRAARRARPATSHTYWRYALRVDPAVRARRPAALAGAPS